MIIFWPFLIFQHQSSRTEVYSLKVIILVLYHFQQVSLFYSLMGQFRKKKKKSLIHIEMYVTFSHIHYTKL